MPKGSARNRVPYASPKAARADQFEVEHPMNFRPESARPGGREARRRPPRQRPSVEVLEGRTLLATTPVVQQLGLLPTGHGAIGITEGPDGNLWFAEFDANAIGRITPTGTITEF